MQPLPQVFRSVITSIARQSPAESADWLIEEEDGMCTLVIPKLVADGFEITVEADDSEVTVYSEFIAHQHFTSDGNHDEVCQMAMGLVRDLLSPAMRLRVIEVGGKVSRAHFETSRAGIWHRESTTALFSLPFFRKRVERFYINRRLPIRKEPNQSTTAQRASRVADR
jgi:hypothetical protein